MVRFVEGMGLADVVADDVVVARLDELDPDEDGEDEE
jgi:hypothetical protein